MHKLSLKTHLLLADFKIQGFGVVGFASLSGPPLAGALIEKGSGSYVWAQVFAGSSMIVAFIILNICRWTQVGFKLKAKI